MEEPSLIEVVRGVVRQHALKEALVSDVVHALRNMEISGFLYLGYPVLHSINDQIDVDGLLVSEEHGVASLIFEPTAPPKWDAQRWFSLEEEQNVLYYALQSSLSRHDSLRVGRELGVNPKVVTVFPEAPDPPDGLIGEYAAAGQLPAVIDIFPPVAEALRRSLNAAVEHVSTMRPAKRRSNIEDDQSRGAIIRKIEEEIANLDQWQKLAAIETPAEPQRIRGLAGSGKTIVLALKAAYLHSQQPDWNIAVVFYTRSLYQQFRDLIQRFVLEQSGDDLDWDKLRILHAWGGTRNPGMYSTIATAADAPVRSYSYGSTRFADPFSGICDELLSELDGSAFESLFDAVLIDEAQDLPESFFKVVYEATHDPKRVILAYDELQKLSESGMPDARDLFGRTKLANPLSTSDQRVMSHPAQTLFCRCAIETHLGLSHSHTLSGLVCIARTASFSTSMIPRSGTTSVMRSSKDRLSRGSP